MSPDQRAKLSELLKKGAVAHGFRREVWTCHRVAQLIKRKFGVGYHPAHVSRILKGLGFSLQKPDRLADQRDEDAIKEWREKRCPQLKRGSEGGQEIMFVDQSGFYLLPRVVRTYAPVGQTPILHEELTRDHLSAMSGITPEGKLLMLEQERAFKGEDVVCFLKHALSQIPGKLLIVWDSLSIHRSEVVKEFLHGGASERIRLKQLPGYAPQLNPDEGIWKQLKYTELKNLCCQGLAELRVELRKANERLRYKKHVILGCIRQPGLEV